MNVDDADKFKDVMTKALMEMYDKGIKDATTCVEEAIKAAILLERGACAKLCDDLSAKWYDEGGSASDCATAIRHRGD